MTDISGFPPAGLDAPDPFANTSHGSASDRPMAKTSNHWLRRPPARTFAALSLGAIGFDLVLRGPVGLLTVVSLGLLVLAAVVGRWVTAPAGWVCLGASAVPLMMLLLRASWWLVPLNVIAVLGLVVLACELRNESHAVSRAAARLVRPTPALFSMVAWPALLLSPLQPLLRAIPGKLSDRASGRSVSSFARGLIITMPVAGVLLLLLGSSDALFGSFLTVPAAPDEAFSHGARFVAGACVTAVIATRALRRVVEPPLRIRPLLGPTELTMLLGAITAIYAAFVGVQAVAALAGAAYLQETTGLTAAEYARSGFFQLLAAAALTLVVLLAGKRHADVDAGGLVVGLSQATVALTLATVAVAVRRLLLYEDVFGLTMLRLYTVVFALFIASVFILTSMHLVDRLPFDHLTGTLAVAFGFLVIMNLVNPEAVVADRNIDRFGSTAQLDMAYLVNELGSDAVPRILSVDGQSIGGGAGDGLRTLVCAEVGRPDNRLRYYNRSRVQAFAVLDDVCSPGWGTP